jgi:hypothetical protein
MYITESPFPDFDYKGTEISKYQQAAGIFTMLLKNGEIIHYEPAVIDAFEEWLSRHNVENIRNS